jgi:hypothetical protein
VTAALLSIYTNAFSRQRPRSLGWKIFDDQNDCYRANALGQADSRITPHALYRSLGLNDAERQRAYRLLFRSELDKAAAEDIRLALSQNQPLGNARFHEQIERAIGVRREAKPRCRPSLAENANTALMEGQGKLEL